jgi:ABC-type spermidine/putrescine transport system permease subunit II
VSPEINVLATITVTLVASLIVGASLWMARQDKIRQREIQQAVAANA